MILEDIIGGSSYSIEDELYNIVGKHNENLGAVLYELIETSKTYTVPASAEYLILASGGGGGGCVNRAANPTGSVVQSAGASSGDVKYMITTLTQDETIIISIGAGGSAVSTSSDGGFAGNDGGVTTVTGYLTANGGNGATRVAGTTPQPKNDGFFSGGASNGQNVLGDSGEDSNIPAYLLLNNLMGRYSLLFTTKVGGSGAKAWDHSSAGGGAASLLGNGGSSVGSTGNSNISIPNSGILGSGGGSIIMDAITGPITSGAGGDGWVLIMAIGE